MAAGGSFSQAEEEEEGEGRRMKREDCAPPRGELGAGREDGGMEGGSTDSGW